MKKKKTESVSTSPSPKLSALIKVHGISESDAFSPVIRIASSQVASLGRASISQTSSDVELVRRGDRGAALERLADRMCRGWIEPAWGGDPMTLPPWAV